MKGRRIEFENGRDVLRGTVISKFVDSKRPDMEETWTVFCDSVLFKEPVVTADGHPATESVEIRRRDGTPVLDKNGEPKRMAVPVFKETWIVLVDADGNQPCDADGRALYKNFGGEPLQLVKNGVPVPFRVRRRRMKEV